MAETARRRRLRRWWPVLAAFYAWAVSSTGAALHIWNGRATAGLEADFSSILLWQGLAYGLWLPIGLVLLVLVRRFGLGKSGLVAAAVWALPALAIHASATALLDAIWSVRMERHGLAAAIIERLPVDMLVYMVLAAALWALAAYRRAGALAAALEAARAASPGADEPEETLLVSLGTRRVPVPVNAIEWLGGAGNYVVVNWDGRDGLVRSTLGEFEQRLDPSRFARIHRSTIANLARVESASSLSDGSWRLTMKSGAELVASRSYRDQILERLGRR